ncbi:MAG: hypothetical protein KDJ39_10060 [Gammaproteobacteria bacterium]|nr:hypothetical protein [Gammaproteobacteria bacterium]MCP5299699.1 hypothetical protein [Chromatiaceae bacterium]
MTPKNWIHQLMLPHWLNDESPDHKHPHRRRFTVAYRRKQGIVKNVWIASGLLMAIQGSLPLIATLTLGTTFLSFVLLDETD